MDSVDSVDSVAGALVWISVDSVDSVAGAIMRLVWIVWLVPS